MSVHRDETFFSIQTCMHSYHHSGFLILSPLVLLHQKWFTYLLRKLLKKKKLISTLNYWKSYTSVNNLLQVTFNFNDLKTLVLCKSLYKTYHKTLILYRIQASVTRIWQHCKYVHTKSPWLKQRTTNFDLFKFWIEHKIVIS